MRTLFALITLTIGTFAFGQQTTTTQTYFAIFIVDGIETKEDHRAVDQVMYQEAGVEISRMDIPTDRYYVVYTANQMHPRSWFESKFSAMGNYTIHCYYEGVKGIDPFVTVTRNNCPELN